MAKVYIFLAEGFEEIEGLTVVDMLRRAKIDISMVSITGNRLVTGSHQITTTADQLFEETDFDDADLLVLPGGMPGTKNLLEHEGLDRLLKEFNTRGKSLAAICAAPRVLGTKGLLNSKKATCYPGNEESLIGAHYVDTAVVKDGNITTSKGMGTAIDFSLSLIKSLVGEEEAKSIAAAIQYQYYN
ncbi:MAG TPA: DJ-1 family glyoxalase III [Mobilitalea sp.]|nr:DJ-1 family glyoxalase III [Mobilitalea sp.]